MLAVEIDDVADLVVAQELVGSAPAQERIAAAVAHEQVSVVLAGERIRGPATAERVAADAAEQVVSPRTASQPVVAVAPVAEDGFRDARADRDHVIAQPGVEPDEVERTLLDLPLEAAAPDHEDARLLLLADRIDRTENLKLVRTVVKAVSS